MRPFPGFDKLFHVGGSPSSRPFQGYLKPDPLLAGGAELLALTRGEWRPDYALAVGHSRGGAPQDFIWLGPICVLMNRRVVRLLDEYRFTGWGTYAVDLRGKRDESIDGYVGLAVHGRCGPIDKSKAQTAWREYPTGMFLEGKGLYFDPASWDGSDFFMTTSDHAGMFVSDAVRTAFTEGRIRNVTFSPLSEYWWGEP
jgi:hypothetical protein